MGLSGSEHGKTWQEALADLFVELSGLVKEGRELVQAHLDAEAEEKAARAQALARTPPSGARQGTLG